MCPEWGLARFKLEPLAHDDGDRADNPFKRTLRGYLRKVSLIAMLPASDGAQPDRTNAHEGGKYKYNYAPEMSQSLYIELTARPSICSGHRATKLAGAGSMNSTSRIFVTERSGMVGSALVHRLQDMGCQSANARSGQEINPRNLRAVFSSFQPPKRDYLMIVDAKVSGNLGNNTLRGQFQYHPDCWTHKDPHTPTPASRRIASRQHLGYSRPAPDNRT